jgi:hypothetical protein
MFFKNNKNLNFNKMIRKKINKIKMWNYSFLLKHNLEEQSYFNIIYFYILNIPLIIKDLSRFKIL